MAATTTARNERQPRRASRAVFAAAAFALAVAIPATAFAGKGSGGSTSSAWIALRAVDGAALSAASAPTLGSWVSFSTGYATNVKNPRIEVDCYQSGNLVFGMAGSVLDSFQLGGGGSLWLTNGGAANCTATLFYFGSSRGAQTYNVLATTSFDAV